MENPADSKPLIEYQPLLFWYNSIMHTRTWYNPDTNILLTSKRFPTRTGFTWLGYKKIAEAFTSVSADERPKLWLALHGKTYSFDFTMLNSKLRHKLTRLGLYPFGERDKTEGQILLDKISKK